MTDPISLPQNILNTTLSDISHNRFENTIDKNIKELNAKLQLKMNRSMEINSFILLKDNIKNFRKLSEYEKMYIPNLSTDEKIEILLLYDQVLSIAVELL